MSSSRHIGGVHDPPPPSEFAHGGSRGTFPNWGSFIQFQPRIKKRGLKITPFRGAMIFFIGPGTARVGHWAPVYSAKELGS